MAFPKPTLRRSNRLSKLSKVTCGGYDLNQFVELVGLERYTCTICAKVFRDPHLTACCGQNFCEDCLSYWLERHVYCPNCREQNFGHIVDKKFQREIDALVVLCSNYGCKCKIMLGSLKEHLEECDYTLVNCPNKCQVQKLKRKVLNESHLKYGCPKRPYWCEYCGHNGTYHSITRPFGHYANCQEIPQHCPNKCGEERIKRKDVSTHQKQCPLELVNCPFSDVGCKARLVRSDMTGHVESSVQDHLLITAQAFTEIKTEMKKQKKAVSIHVNKMLKQCEPPHKYPLESIRAILDNAYHLRKEGDQLQIDAIVDESEDVYPARWGMRRARCYGFLTPSFFFGDGGYKMKILIVTTLLQVPMVLFMTLFVRICVFPKESLMKVLSGRSTVRS